MVKTKQLTIWLILWLLGLVLACGQSPQVVVVGPTTADSEIVEQIFGNKVDVEFDEQGRVIKIVCPRHLEGEYDRAIRDFLGLLPQCPPLESLPPEIGQLTALKHLSFTGPEIITLPPEIGNLTNLEVLAVCRRERLPSEFDLQ